MGIGSSHPTKLEREFGGLGDGNGEERFFGLENFGNTCYCNSVLQALYFCEPLRHHLAELREEDAHEANGGAGTGSGTGSTGASKASGASSNGSSLIMQLADLFALISRQKRRSGYLAPTDFLRTLRERNELFRGNMQQDAHEFFNFVLNEMADSMVARNQRIRQREAAAVAAQDQKQRNSQNPSLNQQHQQYGLQQPSLTPQQQQQHPPQNASDPRRSAWPKLGLKSSFGNGPKTAPPATIDAAAAPAPLSAAHPGAEEQTVGREGLFAAGDPVALGRGDSVGSAHPRPTEGDEGLGSSSLSDTDTWVHRIFQGVLTNQTKCLCCETVSNRDEPFMDLSLDVEQNSSVTACLRSFSSTETLTRKNKFFCEHCNALQEAEKKIRLKRLPRVLTLHLKRFKYVESLDSFSKLSHRVVFPLELRAPNMTEGPGEADADGRLYRLFAVVVHIGRGPNHGHYVAVVKCGGRWLLFDDEIVELVDEQVLKQCFGLSRPAAAATNTGYLLLYDCGEDSGECTARRQS